MHFGVCQWIFGGEDLPTTAEFLAKAGFDGIELYGDPNRNPAKTVNGVLGDQGLCVLSLTCDDVDLAHPDEKVRRSALDYFYRLVDYAAEIDHPIITCHGLVGRVRAIDSLADEYAWLISGVRQVADRADRLNLKIAIEVLNRYETHLLNTTEQALGFLKEIGLENVGLLLDAYHMNIEEADPAGAIMEAGPRLFLYHAADSNRQAVGRGHTDFLRQMRALRSIGYDGSVIIECSAVGPDPFTAVKGSGWKEQARQFAQESLDLLRIYEGMVKA